MKQITLKLKIENEIEKIKFFFANGSMKARWKHFKSSLKPLAHPAITCSKLTIETLEQGVKYVQN